MNPVSKIKKLMVDFFSGLFNLEARINKTKFIRKAFVALYLYRRAILPLDHLNELAKEIPLHLYLFSTPEIHKSNDWYGAARTLKKYAGLGENSIFKANIEHGLYSVKELFIQDSQSDLPVMITIGTQRAAFLSKNTNKKVYAIGPYIYYADDIDQKKFEQEKKRLGKNLLVFAVHSTGISKVSYDINLLCKKIRKIGKDFDSVRVCLYWKDIEHGYTRFFKEQGFECVTAGYMLDPKFLSRLKTIIKLADLTVSQDMGTHIGYCILFNKPHFIIGDGHSYSGSDKAELELIKRGENSAGYKKIASAFTRLRSDVSSYQLNIVNQYWGINQIKSPEEIRSIYETAEKLYAQMKHKNV